MVFAEHLIRKVIEPSGAREKLLRALIDTRREAFKGSTLRAQMDQLVEENEHFWNGLRKATDIIEKFAIGDHTALILRLRKLLSGIPPPPSEEGEEPS